MIAQRADATHPLVALIHLRPEPLAAMAAAWIESGVAYFGIWGNEQVIMGWPDQLPPTGSVLTAPIRINGRLSGELRVYGRNMPAAAERRLLADAEIIAHLAMLETEMNNMTLELIENQDQLLALYDLTQSTRSRLDLREVLYLLGREGARLVKAQFAFTLLSLPNQAPIIAHYPEARFGEATLMRYLDRVRANGQKIVSREDAVADHNGLESLLVAPIRVRGEIIAIIGLMNKPGGFTSPDMKLINAIADQAGAQVENVLLYQETLSQAKLQTEMQLAQDVQLHLLPSRPPQVYGLSVFAGSLPASQVGGDFYDFYDAPGQPFRFSLGDVTGKGISAAMLMAMTRTTFRNRIRNIGNTYPADIMGAANDDMYDDFTELTMFATVFFGQYHHQERAIYYANAGHSPVVYCPFGGPSYLVEADGTALGVLPTSLCENHMMPFQPGDVLVAATDGFVEARNPQGDMFGYDRFLGLIETYAHEDPETLGGILYQAVATFSAGQPQDDDQTLVVVKGVE